MTLTIGIVRSALHRAIAQCFVWLAKEELESKCASVEGPPLKKVTLLKKP
jgi:hypothetical protein